MLVQRHRKFHSAITVFVDATLLFNPDKIRPLLFASLLSAPAVVDVGSMLLAPAEARYLELPIVILM